ncbi:DUF3087 family protein [Flocculibacter collagenilyticus]|uniref:DUF3087 family protein n=1 Tax=Flocculibacter collagenilyticus TaxID=2744479 RepID=UPI0018F48963|nr:DUF3087 family protein [Flocculibacter collagenilyticus]
MQLQTIDKKTYRKHLNIAMFAGAVLFAALALGISTLTIFLFTDGQGTHFSHNLAGVAVALVIMLLTFKQLRARPFFKEISYVLDLKHQLNLIYRKSSKINEALKQNDTHAITIMYFNYQGMKQLYTLDDNTITMDELSIQIAALDTQIKELNLSVSSDDYSPELLDKF